MTEHEGGTPTFGDPRSQSPVSVISRFSYEDHQRSNNGDSPLPGNEPTASPRSSVSASSQISTHRIGLARPLSAAIISSNDRFTSSATPDLARQKGLESTEQIFMQKHPTVIREPYNRHEKETDDGNGRPMWNPFWLWRTTLLGFIAVFFLLALLLVVLYHFSNRHNGLSSQIISDHYSWTYGPTAGGSILKQYELPGTNRDQFSRSYSVYGGKSITTAKFFYLGTRCEDDQQLQKKAYSSTTFLSAP